MLVIKVLLNCFLGETEIDCSRVYFQVKGLGFTLFTANNLWKILVELQRITVGAKLS